MNNITCDISKKEFVKERVDFRNEIDGMIFEFDLSVKRVDEDGKKHKADISPECMHQLIDGAEVYVEPEPEPEEKEAKEESEE